MPVSWMQIVTWNDWNEGTEIEPSIDIKGKEGIDYGFGYGYIYLKKTRDHVCAFKAIEKIPDDTLFLPYSIYKSRLAIEEGMVCQDGKEKLDAAIKAFYSNRFKEALSLLSGLA